MARQERFEIPCRECGKPLIFIRTRAGKNMPCEAEPVLYWPDADGPLLFYQRDGSYERGTLAGHPAVPQESGYVPHWGRCPGRRRDKAPPGERKRTPLEQRIHKQHALEEEEEEPDEEQAEGVSGCPGLPPDDEGWSGAMRWIDGELWPEGEEEPEEEPDGHEARRCPYCGSTDWEYSEEEFEEIWAPITTSLGHRIPGAHEEVYLTGEIDVITGLPVPAVRLVPFRVPYYKPRRYPVVLQKNVSVYGQFLGDSDIDKITDQQNTTNRLEKKIIDKLISSGSFVTLPADASVGIDENDMRVYRPANPADANMIGVYLTNDPNDMSPDMWQAELGETLPGLFDADNLDMRSFMERVVQVAEEGRNEQVSLAEYTQMLADENYVSEDQALADLEQRVDWELRSFAEKADLEVRLRGRGADGISNTERKRIIQEERANYWQLHKQYQEETRRRIAEERQKRHASEKEARERINDIIREERAKYWQNRRDYQQRADERVRQEREKRWAAQAETRQRIDDVEQAERRTYYERLERYKEARRATDARERERRKAMSERRRETAELRNLQQRTLKQIQWLAKNQYRAPAELKQQWDEVLGDLDIFAVSAANEMNYSKKFDATWRDISEMYKKARDTDPNFLPSQELERIVARLDNDKIGDLDIGALQEPRTRPRRAAPPCGKRSPRRSS